MSAVPISIKATNPQDGYQRVWALFVDTPPGTYRGSDMWDAGVPPYEALANSGDTWNPPVDLSDGTHDLYFVVSSPDTGLGQYSGTITIAGTPHDFSGVTQDASAHITVSISQGPTTYTVEGQQVAVPQGTTDIILLKLYAPLGSLPGSNLIFDPIVSFFEGQAGYNVVGTTIVGSTAVVFVKSPTGGLIPLGIVYLFLIAFVAAMVLIGIYLVTNTIIDWKSGDVQIAQSKADIAQAATQAQQNILNDPTLTSDQKAAALDNISKYYNPSSINPNPSPIPGWAIGVGVVIAAGVGGYVIYNIVSNQPRRP